MKIRQFIILGLLAFHFTTYAQNVEVPSTQQALVSEYTATWCPPCGSWGWDVYKSIVSNVDSKAVIFKAHRDGSSKLYSPTAEAIINNFGVLGRPAFYLGHVNQQVSSSQTAQGIENITNQVNDLSGLTPLVQTGVEAFLGMDGTLEVNTSVQFFDNTDGDYYLGVYVIEKEVFESQAGRSSNELHQYILRTNLNGDPFGTSIASGSISKDNVYDFTFTMEGFPYEASNVEIAAIIWNKVGSKYEFINANADSQVDLDVSAVSPLTFKGAMSVFPTPAQQTAYITLDLEESLQTTQIQLVNLNGQVLQTIFTGNLPIGQHQFAVQRTNNMPNGTYFVQIATSQGVTSKAIIFNE